MTETSQAEQQTSRPARHVHHGRTAAAWAGTTIALVAFLLGGIALVVGNWVLFWAAGALAPLLGAALVLLWGYEASFWATLVTMAAALAVLVWKVDEPRRRRVGG